MGAALTLADAGEMLGEVDPCLRLSWRSSGQKPAVSLYEEFPAT
jgi:hypothetical protein